jgi:hypothetical protein
MRMNIKNHKTLTVVLSAVAIVAVACGVLYSYRTFVAGSAEFSATATSTANASETMTVFADDAEGYSLSLPDDWHIEENATSSIAAYSSSPSAPECKISLSAFPAVADDDRASWIAATIGADPTLAVKEDSSEEVSVDGAPAVRWSGTIDGAPATLVYAFSDAHAYEIAPSSMDGGASSCADALDVFLNGITFTSSVLQ